MAHDAVLSQKSPQPELAYNSESEKTAMDHRSNDDTAGEDTADESSKHELSNEPPSTAGHDDEPHSEYLHGVQLVTVTACVTLVAFLTLLDTAIVATAVPRITDTFHSLKDVGWYAGAYQLGSAVLQPLSGRLYTLFNTKWTFLAFFAVFELGSLICGVATSSTMLIVGRAVSGLGSAGIMNGGLTVIASVVPLHKRAQLTGIMMGCCQMGIVCGPLLGGVFTQEVTWRWCFYINLPIGGAVAAFLFLIHIPEQMKKPQPRAVLPQLHRLLDPVGFVLLSAASVQLLLALQFGGSQFPWDSATVIGLFCGSGATYFIWAGWNYRMGDAAMIPVSMAKKRVVWSAALTQMLFFINTFMQAFFLPIYFQAVKGSSPLMAGVYMLPNIGMQIITAVSSGILGKYIMIRQ
ncbi:hypothetical protein DL546_002596 [Coniochaeta pulveracea]|uniref:Major facilitator superfamily (MFS) profile domain-containing protein n=1 Tax=Coniochaeta pulveracea TaxID=177199 RepID=A0A420Y535_9PEZI|nr:hypothetical protein DL546_002596 [Coniochaeta pulveracea]